MENYTVQKKKLLTKYCQISMTSPNRDKENKPSKKTEWEKAIRFVVPIEGLKTIYDGNGKYYEVTIPVSLAPDFIKGLLHQRDNEIREWITSKKHKTIPCPANPKFTHPVGKGDIKGVCGQCGMTIGIYRERTIDDLITYLSNRTL